MAKRIKIKICDVWYEAIMEQQIISHTGHTEDKVIRKYHLCKPMSGYAIAAFMENEFNEVECDDGHKSNVYMASALTLIEKDASDIGGGSATEKENNEKILITKTTYDGEADCHFDETYLFDKSCAKVVFAETIPLTLDLILLTVKQKETVTRTLWLTRNGGFVLEKAFSSGDVKYSIIEKCDAEKMIKEYSEEKYIEIFHPKEI